MNRPTRATRLREKSGARREQHRAALRQALLDAAGALFLETGFEGFSLRAVAERVGYSPTTVYLHFENKDDLLFAVALEGFGRFGHALQTAYDAAHDPVARIEAIGRAYIGFGLAHPAHYRLMFMERGEFLLRQPKDDKDDKPAIDSFGVLVRAVREAQAAGRLRPGEPMDYVYTLWAGVHGLVALALCVPVVNQSDLEARVQNLMRVLRSGFAREE